MDWEEAMEDAREELGYYPEQYVEDWDELVETAKEICSAEKEYEYEEFCADAKQQHQIYLKSERWKILRLEILNRDNFICQDCKGTAIDVHHIDYNFLGTPDESKYCVSLCKECHMKRHKIVR